MRVYTKEDLNNYELSLTYDDVSLIPIEVSRIERRGEAVTASRFLEMDLGLPVISSPMDTVTGLVMANELSRLGCAGVLNRFDSSVTNIIKNGDEFRNIKIVAVSLSSDMDLIEKLVEKNLSLCIDTANANNVTVLKKCEEIKSRFNTKIIVGNIAHGATLNQLVDSGADAVRIGIGGGSVCTTSMQTGIGIGQVSSLLNTYYSREAKNLKIELIADGGIKGPGDVAKALALGADAVMLGRLLAGTKEAPGEVIKYNDQLWKKYRGSASFGVKMRNEFIEGEETMLAYKGPVKSVIDGISDGLKSAMSYMNCYTLDEFKKINSFAVLSNSSFLERLPKK